MSQHDYVIDNASGATVRADINSALGAIQSLNSGTSAPSSTAAGMLWLDTTGGAPYALKIRDAGNNHWLTIGSVTDPGADGNLSVAAIEGSSVLSTGESGGTKFLREDGDGSCSFQNVTQEMVFLEKFTASSTASKIFDLTAYTSYNTYIFKLNAILSSQGGDNFKVHVGTSSADSDMFDGSGENRLAQLHGFYDGTSHGSGSDQTSTDTFILFTNLSNNSGYGISGTINFFNPRNSLVNTSAKGEIVTYNANGYTQSRNLGTFRTGASNDAFIKFFFNSGSIDLRNYNTLRINKCLDLNILQV